MVYTTQSPGTQSKLANVGLTKFITIVKLFSFFHLNKKRSYLFVVLVNSVTTRQCVWAAGNRTRKTSMPRTIDKATCFVLLTKFAGRPKYSDEEKFARLLKISSYKQELEELYRKNSIRHRDQATLNVLFEILQVQEVGSIEQYHLNGLVLKVHVLEDTEL